MVRPCSKEWKSEPVIKMNVEGKEEDWKISSCVPLRIIMAVTDVCMGDVENRIK